LEGKGRRFLERTSEARSVRREQPTLRRQREGEIMREGAHQCDEGRQTMDSWTITRETTISGRESEACRRDEDERMGEEWANGDGG